MNNYDDLQRFKEKTQTLDIAFKDMSGQTHETSRSQWALIRQLENSEQPDTPLGGKERIDMPQPQPVRQSDLSTLIQMPTAAAPESRLSLLDSIAANLPPVSSVVSLSLPGKASDMSSSEAIAPAVLPTTQIKAPAREEKAAEPARFGALFRMHSNESVSVSKETLLKPLLEKIALCR
ncbi:cellulose biosynthesis protein BcsO [[Erwinia] mediterraneensis]|uniref:cellulose biosynthesis protein BcsO n=1 Tax=[Erwinia] mediterraneensis TaxID=2161819 RepID=UPI00102FF1FF|nr:cellulose biosynthesis protein BcsO [[Erwinia] mediterraneensis]